MINPWIAKFSDYGGKDVRKRWDFNFFRKAEVERSDIGPSLQESGRRRRSRVMSLILLTAVSDGTNSDKILLFFIFRFSETPGFIVVSTNLWGKLLAGEHYRQNASVSRDIHETLRSEPRLWSLTVLLLQRGSKFQNHNYNMISAHCNWIQRTALHERIQISNSNHNAVIKWIT